MTKTTTFRINRLRSRAVMELQYCEVKNKQNKSKIEEYVEAMTYIIMQKLSTTREINKLKQSHLSLELKTMDKHKFVVTAYK